MYRFTRPGAWRAVCRCPAPSAVRRIKFRGPVLALAAVLTLVGCSDRITSSTEMVYDRPNGAGNGPGEIQGTLTQVQTQVFDASCAFAGCHANSTSPDLQRGTARAALVGVRSSTDLPLVTAGDPDASYLMVKITGGAGMRGARMPYGAASLDAATVELLRSWIAAGALDN